MNSIEYKNRLKKVNNKTNKFNNKKIKIDNILFDSTLEGNRYLELKKLEKLGVIKELELQKKYPFVINEILVTTYKADFVYKTKEGNLVVEDTKGVITKEYAIKRKLMLAIYGIKIKEIYIDKRK